MFILTLQFSIWRQWSENWSASCSQCIRYSKSIWRAPRLS